MQIMIRPKVGTGRTVIISIIDNSKYSYYY